MANKKIAIIGAGIMGLCAAYKISRRGHNCMLFDRQPSAPDNASAKAGGMLAPYAEIEHMSTAWLEAGLDGIKFWKEFSQERATGFHMNGSLLVAHPDDQYILERYKRHLQGLPGWEELNEEAITNCEPGLTRLGKNAIFLRREAHLDPILSLRALRKASQTRKVRFEQKNLDQHEIETLTKSYDIVVDCRGMGAKATLPELRGVKGELLYIRNEEFYLSRPVRLMHPRYPLYIVPQANHHFTIGATMVESDGHECVSIRSAMELMSAALSLHPSFVDAEILDIKTGIRPSYSDNLPRIRFEGNIIYCNGLFRHGYLLAPVMAEIIAEHLEDSSHQYKTLFTGGHDDHHDQRAA